MKPTNLLIEKIDFSLTESIIDTNNEKDKKYMIKGIFLQADIKNINKRIYPKQVVENAVANWKKNFFDLGRGCGELEHPDDERDQRIFLKEVSHKIVKLDQVGTDWYGEAEIAKNTPNGKLCCGLMDVGITLGTSSRATGSVSKSNGVSVVQNDLYIITPSDIVYEPSAPDAFLTSLKEHKEWIYENGVLTEREINHYNNKIDSMFKAKTKNARDIENELFNSILESLSNRA